MSDKIDVAFVLDSDGVYDIALGDDGDLLATDGIDTSILMSALCESRANASEVTLPQFRRGDWSNELNDDPEYEVGSKLWLLDNARMNTETAERGVEYLVDGFQWMIDDNILKSVNITYELKLRSILFTAILEKPDNVIEKKYFEIFDKTRAV